MATFQRMSESFGEVWSNLLDGWHNLSRRASRAITRFTLGKENLPNNTSHEMTERSAGWGVLACEVFDNDNKVVVRLEAPGMEKNDFDLQMVEDYLVVRGEKQMSSERMQGGYQISECAYGRFERAIPLPGEVDVEKVKATYKHGVLRVELPKTKSSRRHKVAVH